MTIAGSIIVDDAMLESGALAAASWRYLKCNWRIINRKNLEKLRRVFWPKDMNTVPNG